MNKRGFTLIELLAVIVILAIIALIAVPIVLNMIENARKSAAKSSAYGYIQAIDDNNELVQLNTEPELQTGRIAIADGTDKDISTIQINIKGKKPTKGKVTIANGKVSSATLCINNYTVTYDGTEAEVGEKCSGQISPADPVSFTDDSWTTIAANTTSDKYHVGDEKCIALAGFTTTNNNGCANGEFKVRIANKTTCTSETSQTACGFVVEFVDVIALYNMNSTATNVGGYPASAMYQEYFAYNATNPLYSKLPSDLQNVIISTTVVSGHGSTSGETNFTSTDKLYLLSRQEVFGDNSSYDTAAGATRQLDYYNVNNNNTSRVKQYNGSNQYWWLRSAISSYPSSFFSVYLDGGDSGISSADGARGVAPAFRIGTN